MTDYQPSFSSNPVDLPSQVGTFSQTKKSDKISPRRSRQPNKRKHRQRYDGLSSAVSSDDDSVEAVDSCALKSVDNNDDIYERTPNGEYVLNMDGSRRRKRGRKRIYALPSPNLASTSSNNFSFEEDNPTYEVDHKGNIQMNADGSLRKRRGRRKKSDSPLPDGFHVSSSDLIENIDKHINVDSDIKKNHEKDIEKSTKPDVISFVDGSLSLIDNGKEMEELELGNQDAYEIDGNGDIIRNADGTPRKKRGRKKKDLISETEKTNGDGATGDSEGTRRKSLRKKTQVLSEVTPVHELRHVLMGTPTLCKKKTTASSVNEEDASESNSQKMTLWKKKSAASNSLEEDVSESNNTKMRQVQGADLSSPLCSVSSSSVDNFFQTLLVPSASLTVDEKNFELDSNGKVVLNAKGIPRKKRGRKKRISSPIKASMRKRGRPRTSKVRDPLKPKRPKNAYFLFADSKRDEIRRENPSWSYDQILGKLSELYNNLPKSLMESFKNRAAELGKEFAESMVTYRQNRTETKKPRGRPPKGALKKPPRDPRKPKRPMNAFLLFSKSKTDEIRSQNPSWDYEQVRTKISEMYKSLPDDELLILKTQSEDFGKIYAQCMREYRNNLDVEQKTNKKGKHVSICVSNNLQQPRDEEKIIDKQDEERRESCTGSVEDNQLKQNQCTKDLKQISVSGRKSKKLSKEAMKGFLLFAESTCNELQSQNLSWSFSNVQDRLKELYFLLPKVERKVFESRAKEIEEDCLNDRKELKETKIEGTGVMKKDRSRKILKLEPIDSENVTSNSSDDGISCFTRNEEEKEINNAKSQISTNPYEIQLCAPSKSSKHSPQPTKAKKRHKKQASVPIIPSPGPCILCNSSDSSPINSLIPCLPENGKVCPLGSWYHQHCHDPPLFIVPRPRDRWRCLCCSVLPANSLNNKVLDVWREVCFSPDGQRFKIASLAKELKKVKSVIDSTLLNLRRNKDVERVYLDDRRIQKDLNIGLKPPATLVAAQTQITNLKTKIRNILISLQTYVRSTNPSIPDPRFDHPHDNNDTDDIDVNEVICTLCHSGEASEGNDIFLCDGIGCFRAFHVSCLPEQEEVGDNWFCPACTALGRMVHYVQVEYFGDEGYESEGSWASASQVFKELDKNDRHLIKTEDAIFGDEDDSDDEDFLSEEEESEDESSESDDGSAGSCRDHNQQGDSTETDDSDESCTQDVNNLTENGDDNNSCSSSSTSSQELQIDPSELALLSDVESVSSANNFGSRKLRSTQAIFNPREYLHRHVALRPHLEVKPEDTRERILLGLVTSYNVERCLYCVVYEEGGDGKNEVWIDKNELVNGIELWEKVNGANEKTVEKVGDLDQNNIMRGKRKRSRVDYKKLNDAIFGNLNDPSNLDDTMGWTPSNLPSSQIS